MSDQPKIPPFGPLRNAGEHLSEDKLLAYLDGKLSPAEQHDLEQWLAEESMEADAIEGLRGLPAEDARLSVGKLKHNLRRKMARKKKSRRGRSADQVTWIAIVIILLLAAAAYIVMKLAK